MKVTPILCAMLLIAAVACTKSENTNTTSSETTVSETTATTTAPVTAANETMSTNPAMSTDTSATTGTVTTSTTPAPAGTAATSKRTATHGKTSTAGGGPVVTETMTSSGAVGLPKNPKLPTSGSSGKESSGRSKSQPSTDTGTTTTTTPTTTMTTNPASSTTTEAKPRGASNGALAAAGGQLFRSQCAGCHGADARSNTAIGTKNHIPDFRSAAVQGRSDAELANIIANGIGPVSSSAHKSKHLSQDQINSLVAFVRSLS